MNVRDFRFNISKKTLIACTFSITCLLPVYSSFKIEISPRAIAWADSVYYELSLEQRVSQLFMVDALDDNTIKLINKVDYHPAFILVSANTPPRGLPNSNTSIAPVIIPDLRTGFETGINRLPFPCQATISFMDFEYQQKLLPHLYNWMDVNKYKAFLGTANRAFKSVNHGTKGYTINLPGCLPPGKPEKSVALEVRDIPTPMIRLTPSLSFINNNPRQGLQNSFVICNDNMKTPGEVSVEQLIEQGYVLLTNNYQKDFNRVLFAFKQRWLNIDLLEKASKNILAIKYDIKTRDLVNCNTRVTVPFEAALRLGYENAIGVFQPRDEYPLPIVNLDINIGIITDGTGYFDEFKSMASNHVALSDSNLTQSGYNIFFWLVGPDAMVDTLIEARIVDVKTRFPLASLIMVSAGDNPPLPFIKLPAGLDALVYSPSNLPVTWSAMGQAVFNGIAVAYKGLNPGIDEQLSQQSRSFASTRLKYGTPGEVGLNGDTLSLIDRIVKDAIRKSAIPGAQVLIAKNGVVVFNRNYGYTTYKETRPVTSDIIYDLASVSKIMATLPALMKQYDSGKWQLDNKLSDFVPDATSTDKAGITMSQLLLHESGLPAFIPFYLNAINTEKLKGNLFSNRRSLSHPVKIGDRLYLNKTTVYRDDVFSPRQDMNFALPVAKNLYMNIAYLDTMWMQVLGAKINTLPRVRYSDLNFMLLQKILETTAGKSLDVLVTNDFFKPMGATSLRFNPWKNVQLEKIAPTENDLAFRQQLIQGYVHDQAAAMMGGVAGHSGLFGNANDLAKMAQMFLNKGTYGGYRYLNEKTVKLFSSRHSSGNRRGLGFDKPGIDASNNGSVSSFASPTSFGHTGFTGTTVWIDPEHELIYIFLSNRIYPHSNNKKLMTLGIRTEIQNVLYRAILPL